jgi:hypothetical protein
MSSQHVLQSFLPHQFQFDAPIQADVPPVQAVEPEVHEAEAPLEEEQTDSREQSSEQFHVYLSS